MIYHVSLSTIALVLGFFYLLTHAPGLIWPKTFAQIVHRFPRHLPTGLILTFLASIWWIALVSTADLGEFSVYRKILLTVSVVLLTLTMLLVHQFLAVRGLALLLLLGAQVILDAAFLLDTPLRLVMTCVAYAWAVAGIAFLCVPYWLRDLIEYCFKTETRTYWACGAGLGFGFVLVVLGAWVY